MLENPGNKLTAPAAGARNVHEPTFERRANDLHVKNAAKGLHQSAAGVTKLLETMAMLINRAFSNGYQDPLAYLPRRQIQQFARNQAIYDAHSPATNLYVEVAGRVKVTSIDDGIRSASRLVRREGLFGELSLVNPSHRNEVATSLDITTEFDFEHFRHFIENRVRNE